MRSTLNSNDFMKSCVLASTFQAHAAIDPTDRTIPPVSAQFVRSSIKHQIENATYTDNSVGFGNQPWLKRYITLAIKALRAAAWVSGAVLLTLWPCPAPRVQPAPFI
jgi:hypothetical protein